MDRRVITIQGVVQGVGFRPFVYRLAQRLALRGYVKNQGGGVTIEVEGDAPVLDRFLAELATGAAPPARVETLSWEAARTTGGEGFHILGSDPGDEPAALAPDVATCESCRAELFDTADRRYRYPFLNCCRCGPRLTIIRGTPYDRDRTTMAGFAMCAACRAEYDDPADRRFHAQPTACPACGPRLSLRDADGQPIASADPLADAVVRLRAGRIAAVKGLGGYHLACDATNADAVSVLRRRKHRDEKPFAVMVADLGAAGRLAEISPAEAELLASPRRPIVLLRKKVGAAVADGVAPRNPMLGVMLAYTPLHHLLLNDLDGLPLVMTSGNRSDEPIAFEDADAFDRLAGIADFFLTHDRPIERRCDDAVTRYAVGGELPIRRSRGDAPLSVALPRACPVPTLAVGGQLKAAFALGRGNRAIVGHHLGDLDHYAAFQAFTEAVASYERLFGFRPELLAHDLHPDYASTHYALGRADVPRRLAVQHHHAHLASCLAENGLDEPAIGVTFDGTGYGTDGTVWGGEFLVGDCASFRRAAHLRPVPMPGGEQAIREPWRMALAHLLDADVDTSALEKRVERLTWRAVRGMIGRSIHAPMTSSAGRLFDALAAIVDLRHRVSYEGQAAIELEWAATSAGPDGQIYPFELVRSNDVWVIDTRPLITAVVRDAGAGASVAVVGRRFHATLTEMIAQVCARIRAETGVNVAALSGGVFLNVLLLEGVVDRLTADGFRVCRHRRVSPGDGGLSLGQLAVAGCCPR
jgi:hydrogenase maturation protein HypF